MVDNPLRLEISGASSFEALKADMRTRLHDSVHADLSLTAPGWYDLPAGQLMEIESGATQNHCPADVLVPVLRLGDDRVRREVVRTLSGLTEPRATALLRSALSDSSPAVRTAAAHALGHRKDADALPDLLDCVRSPEFTGREPGEVVGFLEALVGVADDRAVPTLVSLSRDRLLHSLPLNIRLGALRGLAAVGTPTAAAGLQKARRSRKRTIRQEAERCLLELGNRREPPLEQGD